MAITEQNAGLVKHLWIAGAVTTAVALVLLLVSLRGKRNMLAATIVGAIGAFLLVTGWLFVVDSTTAKGEAIKTGGLAGGSVIALYALWLNDRKRRTEEARQAIEKDRQDLENQRSEHDRSRVADERFARAVELLGHETDQVRVGALHALAGLAKSRVEYTQTVLDILCSYLRRPFDGQSPLENEVRTTAQQLISDLLPRLDQVDAPHYDLNLTNARLEYFDLENRQVGNFAARRAQFISSNAFHHTAFHGNTYFTGAQNHGRLYLHDSVFHARAWFSNFVSHDNVDFHDSKFLGSAKFAYGTYLGGVSFSGTAFSAEPDIRALRVGGGGTAVLPDGWTADTVEAAEEEL
ncbi:hypothetical protein [Umezawaea tangerina]|uniref:hypothetical protein n=1 Tax=Umezawaea tangerina TaxID=84725 RepID=UPI0011B25687|nr:hypothetical protein [Umezawaea tangerina]